MMQEDKQRTYEVEKVSPEDDPPHLDNSSSNKDEVPTPEAGMEFSSEQQVRQFYRSYAQRLGFGISKVSCKNGDDDGKQKYFSLGCSKNGKTKSTTKPSYHGRLSVSTKTDCSVKLKSMLPLWMMVLASSLP